MLRLFVVGPLLTLIFSLRIELTKHSSSIAELNEDVELQLKSLRSLKKFNISSNVYVPLRSPSRMGYHGRIGLGTPAQTFKILFDSGSAEFWVPSRACRVAQCTERNRFDVSASSTYARAGYERFEISYIKGRLHGDVGVETLKIDDAELRRHPVGLAEYIGPKSFEGADFDGICGLCVSKYSSMRGPGLLEHLKQAKLIDRMVFSFYLETMTKGTLMLGYYDTSLYDGELSWLRTKGYHQWELSITSFRIGENEYPMDSAGALIDSGSNMILIPSREFHKLAESIGARRLLSRLWEVECSRRSLLPRIEFILDGVSLSMSPYEYVGLDDDRKCILSIVPYNAGTSEYNYWILGDPFLRVYYSVFDAEKKRIGLARAASYRKHQ